MSGPRLQPRGFRPRPYRHGDRLMHRSLGRLRFLAHCRSWAGESTYKVRVETDKRVVYLLAAFCCSRLRKIAKAKP